MNKLYSPDFLLYKRRSTREVNIGGVPLGGSHPVRLQSMTNTPTSDVLATVKQIIAIAAEGADYVRLTVPGKKDADALPEIVAELSRRNCIVPLVADIHFNPKLALISAEVLDKVRINPGNYVDKKNFKLVEYTTEEYQEELSRLRVRFKELIETCRRHGTALRIGTNHGSLSDRIMSRYGDTPEGMVESAMEFLRICMEEDFHDVVVSMKASNTRVMVYANRLLVVKMLEEGMDFPLHLGVTEAGEGEDGRIRSAVGIGTMLADGIGETIRVSLTEDPELEIPVARLLRDYIAGFQSDIPISPFGEYPIDPFHYNKVKSHPVANIGGENVPVVIHRFLQNPQAEDLKRIGWYHTPEGSWEFSDQAADYILVSGWPDGFPAPPPNRVLISGNGSDIPNTCRVYSSSDLTGGKIPTGNMAFLSIDAGALDDSMINRLRNREGLVIFLETGHANPFASLRAAMFRMINARANLPVILCREYQLDDAEALQIRASADLGGLFIDGLADGLCISNSANIPENKINAVSFGILQASRVRMTKTEFISCPSCGRTLFDLQETTRKIRSRTGHLKGLKIGIMGCIVNGPGEMADADYGYVGAGKGRITLYKEKEVVRRNIPADEAVEALIDLIRENGDWVEPPS